MATDFSKALKANFLPEPLIALSGSVNFFREKTGTVKSSNLFAEIQITPLGKNLISSIRPRRPRAFNLIIKGQKRPWRLHVITPMTFSFLIGRKFTEYLIGFKLPESYLHIGTPTPLVNLIL
jgi:hypothetical protein